MKKLLWASLAILFSISLTAQEQILKHCIVLEFNSEVPNDLQKASFELPFLAKRSGSKSEIKEKYYGFDLTQKLPMSHESDFKVEMEHVKPYKYGQEYAPDELGFFVMEFEGKVLAFFPSINNSEVITEYIVFNKDMDLPQTLVDILNGKYSKIEKGSYKIEEIEF